MSCADFRSSMSAELDCEAGDENHRRPPDRAHLARCADCARWLADVRRLREVTRTAAGPTAQQEQRLLSAVLDALGTQGWAERDGVAGGDGTADAHQGS
ncbi:hypothetical protein [Kitasatospora sp. LaBMicrA B282]|uniref:hypothetical protein n=1 Tax=Kitasatospora sp. LaBMicrA B282 TaxID=3420949 RepID=UPI003D0EA589